MPIHLWPSRFEVCSESSQLFVYKCEYCGHIQLQNLNLDFLKKLYSGEYMNLDSGAINLERANYLNISLKFDSAEILDVGGGTNSTFMYFPSASFTIVDPHIPKEPGAKHLKGFIQDAQLDFEVYDYIFAFHILEHLENPRSDLRKLFDSLKQTGKFVVEVPDAIYYAKKLPHYLYFHQHINLFTVETLDYLFSLEGFHRVDIRQDHGRLLGIYVKNSTQNFYTLSPPTHNQNSVCLINSNYFKEIERNILKVISQTAAERVIFLGAGGSSTLLMYHFPGLLRIISCFMDSDVRKIGLNLPGTRKEIIQMSTSPEPDILYLVLGRGILSNWIHFDSAKVIDILPFLERAGQ
jgi:SAM-dependent methyltransferase